MSCGSAGLSRKSITIFHLNSMWTAASTTGVLATAFSDTGTILVAVIGVIVAALIGLLGLGFGLRHTKKHVTGKKF